MSQQFQFESQLCMPVIVAAITVLILGCWNPQALQHKKDGRPTGCPSYLWLALFALLAGLLCCWLCKSRRMGLSLEV